MLQGGHSPGAPGPSEALEPSAQAAAPPGVPAGPDTASLIAFEEEVAAQLEEEHVARQQRLQDILNVPREGSGALSKEDMYSKLLEEFARRRHAAHAIIGLVL